MKEILKTCGITHQADVNIAQSNKVNWMLAMHSLRYWWSSRQVNFLQHLLDAMGTTAKLNSLHQGFRHA
jgi:hypothetical protein